MGVLSYIGLSHPHFAIHILLGLFSRFGLTVLILPFPLVNHFSGANIGFFFRLFVFVGNGKGLQFGSREDF